MTVLPDGRESFKIGLAVLIQYRRVVVVVVVVVRRRRRAYTRRHNYKVTSAPPSRLSLNKQKCLQ